MSARSVVAKLTWRTYLVVAVLVLARFGVDPGIGGWLLTGWIGFDEIRRLA